MAYLKNLPQRKCSDCSRLATVELVGRRNDSYGSYCATCGKGRLKRLQKTEDEEARRTP